MIIDKTYFVAMAKVRDEYYLLSTEKGLILAESKREEALRALTYIQFESRVIKTTTQDITDKFLYDKTVHKLKNYYEEFLYGVKCNGTANFDEIYANGIKPYTIKQLAKDIIKIMSAGVMPKE